MSDLISRKAVYEMLHDLGGSDATDEWADGWDKAISQAISDLDDIPTAYDVDKVVKRLEKERDLSLKSAGKYYHKPLVRAHYQNAISIVKGAVKDESSNIIM